MFQKKNAFLKIKDICLYLLLFLKLKDSISVHDSFYVLFISSYSTN